MIWLIVLVLVIFWLGGFALNVGGGLIHLLIIIAIIVVLYELLVRRRA